MRQPRHQYREAAHIFRLLIGVLFQNCLKFIASFRLGSSPTHCLDDADKNFSILIAAFELCAEIVNQPLRGNVANDSAQFVGNLFGAHFFILRGDEFFHDIEKFLEENFPRRIFCEVIDNARQEFKIAELFKNRPSRKKFLLNHDD